MFLSGSCCRCCSGHILCPLKAVTKSPLMAVALGVGCVGGITLSMVMNNCFSVIVVFDKPYICEKPSFYRLEFSWLFSSLRHNCTCQNQWIQLCPTSNQFWRFLECTLTNPGWKAAFFPETEPSWSGRLKNRRLQSSRAFRHFGVKFLELGHRLEFPKSL